jgi:hypothetical protein
MQVTIRGRSVTLDYVADIEPTGAARERGQPYRVTLDGAEIVRSAINADLEACRVLREHGAVGRIGFRHRDGMIGLIAVIERGAGLTVDDSAGTPRFARWKEWPGMAVLSSAVAPQDAREA